MSTSPCVLDNTCSQIAVVMGLPTSLCSHRQRRRSRESAAIASEAELMMQATVRFMRCSREVLSVTTQ